MSRQVKIKVSFTVKNKVKVQTKEIEVPVDAIKKKDDCKKYLTIHEYDVDEVMSYQEIK
ncbi:hypothetical protein [Arcobacter roscoffensis]|uniref:Uncharacterized protein n=1 Tax=Arcobacter roscoffensis TaxID=2961520 RepID=A0ABY5E7M9_9BACT|nr:hypothetical protein [Arcobacter roscoffensis]UTJ07882.1 hypothetical protein NJU99_07230 [Arcobacter roscoffensis]